MHYELCITNYALRIMHYELCIMNYKGPQSTQGKTKRDAALRRLYKYITIGSLFSNQ
jgi:hypothetical protein